MTRFIAQLQIDLIHEQSDYNGRHARTYLYQDTTYSYAIMYNWLSTSTLQIERKLIVPDTQKTKSIGTTVYVDKKLSRTLDDNELQIQISLALLGVIQENPIIKK